jgi:dihydrofolate reductase
MILALIAAHDPNLVIGAKGELPWHYKEDMLYFKKTTMGHPVLMGRGVFEEIGEKKLPGRRNVVLSTTKKYPEKDVEVFASIDYALESLRDEEKVFVIGGGEIYRQTLDLAGELYITEIKNEYEGDTFFPEYRHLIGQKWVEIWSEDHADFCFKRYRKKNSKA